jgi:hypothetical protein
MSARSWGRPARFFIAITSSRPTRAQRRPLGAAERLRAVEGDLEEQADGCQGILGTGQPEDRGVLLRDPLLPLGRVRQLLELHRQDGPVAQLAQGRALCHPVALRDVLELILDRAFEQLRPQEGVVFLRQPDGSYQRAATRRLPQVTEEFPYSRQVLAGSLLTWLQDWFRVTGTDASLSETCDIGAPEGREACG